MAKSKLADWTMKCPQCGGTARKDKPEDIYTCEKCGFTSGEKAKAHHAADMIHSDNDLAQKMQLANPAPAEPAQMAEAGGANDEFQENTHKEMGVPVTDGDIKHTERPNVTAVKDAIEAQAEMEIGKPIEVKQEEVDADVAAGGDGTGGPGGDGKSVSIPAGKGVTININIASKKIAGANVAWDVWVGDKWLNRVYTIEGQTTEDVRNSLINHDGYNPAIEVYPGAKQLPKGRPMRPMAGKVAYVSHCPGHTNSKGEKAEWCIRDHKDDHIINSFGSKSKAQEGLKNMHSHSGAQKQAAREFVVKYTTIKDALDRPKTGWWIFEDGRPSSMRATQEQAVKGAEAIAQMRIVDGQVAPVRVIAGDRTKPIGGEHGSKDTLPRAGGSFGGVDLNGNPPNFEKHSDQPQEGYAGRGSMFEGAAPSPDTVARVRAQYTSGMGRQSCMDYFKITEKQLDDILSGKYGRGKISSYHELKAAFVNKTAAVTIETVKQAGTEWLKAVRIAAITVSQGVDSKGDHMLVNMNGREYVLYGQDAEAFRREYAAIKKPEAAVNALVEKYLWKLQPYQKKTVPIAPGVQEKAQARDRAEGLADADAYWEGKEKQPNDYKRYSQSASAKKADEETQEQPQQEEKADYWGYDNWITGHTALMIDNTETTVSTRNNLTRSALRKQQSAKELAAQFARFFKKQEQESRDLYEENALDARERRGKFEREQLEGRTPEPTGNKAKDFVQGIQNLWYEHGGQSGWEEPAGPVDWEAIAEAAMNEERIQNPKKYKPTTKQDDQMLKGMGIKMESLKTAKQPMPQKGSPEWHQLKIAIKTLQMNDVMAAVMGGPSKDEARQIVAKYGINPAKYDTPDTSPITGKKPVASKAAGEGAAKSPEEIEKEAGFSFFIPGQVLTEFYPDLQHEVVDYPNDTNSPMLYPDIVGDKDEFPSEVAIEAAVEVSLDPTRVAYVSTSPAAGAGIGRDGKPTTLEGAPLRKEDEIRGPMFYDEFFLNHEEVPGKALNAVGSKQGSDPAADGHSKTNNRGAGQMFMEEYHAMYDKGPKLAYIKMLKLKTAGADEAKQFGLFLQKVTGEIAATFVAAFKVTNRPILDKVPGTGEIQLANIEQPQGLSSFNLVNTQSRVKYLLDKLTDSEVQDAINDAFAQAAVWHDGGDGGFVYEVFVRIESIDTDSMIAKYKFVCGTKE